MARLDRQMIRFNDRQMIRFDTAPYDSAPRRPQILEILGERRRSLLR